LGHPEFYGRYDNQPQDAEPNVKIWPFSSSSVAVSSTLVGGFKIRVLR
jgi:hypothetical protein